MEDVNNTMNEIDPAEQFVRTVSEPQHLAIAPNHKDSLEAYGELYAAESVLEETESPPTSVTHSIVEKPAPLASVCVRSSRETITWIVNSADLGDSGQNQDDNDTKVSEKATNQKPVAPKERKSLPRPLPKQAKFRRTARQPKPVKLYDGVMVLPWKKRKGKAGDRSYREIETEETSAAPSPVLKKSKKRKVDDMSYRPERNDDDEEKSTKRRKHDASPELVIIIEVCR